MHTYSINHINSFVPVKHRVQAWSRMFFAEHLKENGFVSYCDEDISWYRLVNGELLQTVYLYSRSSSAFTAFASIGYGMHPLFISAPIPQKPVVRGWTDDEIMTRIRLQPPLTTTVEIPSLMVPTTDLRGAEKLDEFILPLFEECATMTDAYLWYKSRYLVTETPKRTFATPEFIDWVIYMGDTQMYAFCIRALEQWNMPDKKTQQKKKTQIAAMRDGQRDIYLKTLETKKKCNITRLQNKVGIMVP